MESQTAAQLFILHTHQVARTHSHVRKHQRQLAFFCSRTLGIYVGYAQTYMYSCKSALHIVCRQHTCNENTHSRMFQHACTPNRHACTLTYHDLFVCFVCLFLPPSLCSFSHFLFLRHRIMCWPGPLPKEQYATNHLFLFLFLVLNPHYQHANYSRNAHRWRRSNKEA